MKVLSWASLVVLFISSWEKCAQVRDASAIQSGTRPPELMQCRAKHLSPSGMTVCTACIATYVVHYVPK